MGTLQIVEEASLTVGELLPIQKVMLTPGACSEACHIFLGRVDTTNAGGVFGLSAGWPDLVVAVGMALLAASAAVQVGRHALQELRATA